MPDSQRGFLEAVYALEELADGRTPEPARLLAGALALETACQQGSPSRDFLDAAAGLKTLATGGRLDLSQDGRRRAADLAAAVRLVAAP